MPIRRISIHLPSLFKTPRETKQILLLLLHQSNGVKVNLPASTIARRRRRRLLGPPLRHTDENRGAAEPAEPPGGVVGVQVVEGGAPPAEGVDAAPPVGEAVQARARRRQGEPGQGAGLVPERSRAWIHARDGRRGARVLGERGEGESGGVVPEGGGAW